MSWLYSRALVAAYSADTCSAGVLSAPLSAIPTPQAYCAPGRMTAFSRLSRFGMTFAPLTETHGEAVLTSYLVDFPVRTSVPPVRGGALMASVVASGEKWRESSVKYCRTTSSWKTHRCLWDEALRWSSVTLPRWGMTVDGLVLQHPTSERPISGIGSGLWPTPLASNTKANHMRSGGRPARSYWTTPSATDGMRGGKITESMTGTSLTQQINTPSQWPTPTVCGNYNRKGLSASSGDGLATAVRNWQTPVATMSKGSSPAALTRKDGQDRSNDRLDHAVMASDGGQLNPTWVEWLMGWPLGWTDLKPLETDRFREWQQQHGGFCRDE